MSALDHNPDRFINLPFRRGDKDSSDWSLCLKYIHTNHSGNNTSAVEDAINKLTAYHATIVKTCSSDSKHSPTESFVEHTLKPYCRLVAMAQAHLPLNGGKVSKNLTFCWRDSFDDSIKYDSLNSNTEFVSCVYNLAASHNAVAVLQAQNGTVEDVREAFRHFQHAAGYYNMVESLLGRLPPEQLTKGDMRKESLTMLTRVCLAQAHHCGYLKAEEAMKDNHSMLAKIAKEGAKQYDEAHTLMKASSWYTSKGPNAKAAEAQLAASALVMHARASLHLAVQNEKQHELGIAIAYYNQAQSYLSRLPKMPTQPMLQWINSVINSVNAAQDAAEKSNTSVYYARIPKEVDEPQPLPRPLGQPTEHPSFISFESKRGADPFFGIVPAHIATVAMQWREKQRSRIHTCASSAAQKRKTTQDQLQQLGVAAAIQTLSGEMQDRGRVPEPLRSNILKLREGPTGETVNTTDTLVQLVDRCEQLSHIATDKLQAIEAELEKEKQRDMRYRDAYGEVMWRAVYPASESTPDHNSISAAVTEHRSGLQQWCIAPFGAAKQTLDENLQKIARLDWPVHDLDALMPFVKTKEARQQSGKVTELIEELKTVVDQKDAIEKEQRAAQKVLEDLLDSDNVVFGLSAVEASQRDAVLAKATQRISDAIEAVNTKTREEGGLVDEAAQLMSRIGELQSADPLAEEIQKVTNSLENGCSTYAELRKELESIESYCSSAIDAIEKTYATTQSFVTSRGLEAEELQSSLDAQIAAKMSAMQTSQSDLAASRYRPEALQQPPPAAQSQPLAPPPPPSDAPPSYESVLNQGALNQGSQHGGSFYSTPPSYTQLYNQGYQNMQQPQQRPQGGFPAYRPPPL